ncbi:MAG: hypothetical protein ACRCZ6_17325 [Kluyvera sp.]|uniref:hypothetical protein n=1 Tax=Kluyvera sp. TaxID=1538228 RepID=UPI003F2BD67F
MEEKNFTPGPWEWWTSNSFLRLSSKATGKDGGVIDSTVMRDGHPTLLVKKEDMALIAAAPELLEALLELVGSYDDFRTRKSKPESPQANEIIKARAAIAKALGKE